MNYFSKNTLRSTLAMGLASVVVTAASLSGCKKSNPLGINSCDDVVKKSEAFSKAAQAFSENMSVANCQKLKELGEDYLKAARNCTLYPNYKEAAEQALAEWGDFDCSEYNNDN